MKTTLYLVRHGQSLGNFENRTLGHTDLDLSELGYRQAEATCEYMKDKQIQAVYSSPLQRAFHTAEPHAKLRGLEVIPVDDLKEIYLGLWEGMRVEDIVHRWPYTFTEVWRANFGLSTPPKGEYVQDAAKRTVAALYAIAERHLGGSVIVTGHGGIFRAAIASLQGVAPERVGADTVFPSNASVTTLTYENGAFTVDCYSYDAHLAEVGITKLKGV